MKKSPKLKIGLVFDDSLDSDDGVAQYVKIAGSWLSLQGHDVSYLVGQTKADSWAGGKVYSLAKNQTVYFNGNKLSMPIYASRKRIKRVLSDNQFDVLHVMVPYSPIMAKKIINLAGPTTAVVGTFHIFSSGLLSKVGSRLLAVWLRPSLNRFDEIVGVSTAATSFAFSGYGLKAKVIPNAIDLERYQKASANAAKSRQARIVFLGRLVKRKGAAELIKAFTILIETHKDVRLTIAGRGPDRGKLEKLAAKHKLGDRVEFLGYVEEKAKPGLLACADVACFPSLYGECFGVVLIEAMAAGSKVILAGNNPGYASVLSDQPVMLVDPKNSQEFADRLDKMLNDRRLIEGLQAWQKDTIKQYDINIVGAKLEKLYLEAIAKRAKTSHNN